MEEEREKRVQQEDIPAERQLLYYIGMALMGLGALLFFAGFLAGASMFATMTIDLDAPRRMATLSTVAMLLLIAGGLLMRVGRYGAAGSGVILDPRKARQDLRPWK